MPKQRQITNGKKMFEERSSVFWQNNSRFGIMKCLFSHIQQSVLVRTECEQLKLHNKYAKSVGASRNCAVPKIDCSKHWNRSETNEFAVERSDDFSKKLFLFTNFSLEWFYSLSRVFQSVVFVETDHKMKPTRSVFVAIVVWFGVGVTERQSAHYKRKLFNWMKKIVTDER